MRAAAAALALALFASPAWPAPDAVQQALGARFAAPAWEVEISTGGPDAAARFVEGFHVLSVERFGAPGSAFASERAYLDGGRGRDFGRPAKAVGRALVAGKRRTVLEAGYPIGLGDPRTPESRPPTQARRRFCLVAGDGGTFFVLSYAWESSLPDATGDGERAWKKLLSSFRVTPPAVRGGRNP